jgi:hypothetical protein
MVQPSAIDVLNEVLLSLVFDGLLESGAKFSQSVLLLTAHRQGDLPVIRTRRIGPALVFGRLWEQLELHQMYRAMGWLGQPLPADEQEGATPFTPRCTKCSFEEALFQRRRHLFSNLELVFFDTTSIDFEGEGGVELGQYGHSKDHRPDRKQMVLAVVLDGEGRPLCCEMWPGNTTDVKTLVPIVDRLKKRFRIGSSVWKWNTKASGSGCAAKPAAAARPSFVLPASPSPPPCNRSRSRRMDHP